MFLSYDTIGYLKGPDIALVKDVETGTVAVRKKLRAELLGVYERLKSVEQANLPRVYETEEYEGECFAYYEYIEGETLEDIVHEGTYTIAQAEEWMEQLCAAMGALHAMQPCVVHRDIKPENIIISNEGVLKLIDLGAARLFKDGKPCDTEQIGTRGYAAPEQYGFNQSDARTDIYAAGTVLHVLMARFGEEAKAYNAVAARCTQLEPQNRYQSAKAMKTALRMAKYKKHIQIGAWALGIAAAAGCVALACTLFASADANANADVPASAGLTPAQEANAEASPEATIDVTDFTAVPYPTVTPKVVAKAVSDGLLNMHFDPDAQKADVITTRSEAEFYEAYNRASNDPHTVYTIELTEDMTLERDLIVWPNIEIKISLSTTLTVPNGISLNNYGQINIGTGSTVRIDDGATLNLGRSTISDGGKTRFEKIYLSGTLSVGKNTEIRFERGEEFGNGPVLEIIHDGVKRCGRVEFDDPSTVKFDDIAVKYIYITLYGNISGESIADYIENEIFPNEQLADIMGRYITSMCFRGIDGPEHMNAVCGYFEDHPRQQGMISLIDMAIGAGEKLKLDPQTYVGVEVFGNVEIADGGEMELGLYTTLSVGNNSTLTVKKGARLAVNNMGLYSQDGSSIIVENGADFEMNNNYQNSPANIIYK
ncbi:MAG: serine/threonine-protein kinase [Clostridia bacterium]|nr:serine/threonine-protein kinase [Clostridia bacterium]